MKRLFAVLATIIMALGVTVAVSSPAAAAWEDCPNGQSCMWSGQNGTGIILTMAFSNYDPVGTCHDLPLAMKSNGESARTRFGNNYGLEFYDHDGCANVPNSHRWRMHSVSAESWFSGYKRNGARSVKIIYYP